MTRLDSPPRAALMLIGDELLSGKIRDENGWHLAQRLRERGVELVEIAVLPDAVDAIASTLRRLAGRAPWLFCSGGVGPTHDDVTMRGVAEGLGRPLVRHSALAQRLHAHYGPTADREVLRMADLPEGAQMYGAKAWPVTGVPFALDAQGRPLAGDSHRIYILPGIPRLFAQKLAALAERPGQLPQGPAWERCELQIPGDESRFSAILREIDARFPEVQIGSYPQWETDAQGALQVQVRVIFESRTPGAAGRAQDAMRSAHPDAIAPSG